MNDIQLEDFRLAFLALWHKKMLIISVTLVGVFAGLLLTSQMSNNKYYIANTSVYAATFGAYQVTSNDVRTMVNYSDVVLSRKVCEYAASLIKEYALSETTIQNMIRMDFNDNSYVMKISAVSNEPELAIKVANAVAQAFVTELSNITGSNTVQILDEAKNVSIFKAYSADKVRGLFAGGAFALICGLIIVRELFTDQLKSINQCVETWDEVLGVIPSVD